MFFKKLLTKWGESLDIFSKKDLTLFFLASLNTLRRSVGILLKECWWLVIFLLFFLRSDAFWVVNRSFYEPSMFSRLFFIDSFSSGSFVVASLLLSFFSFLIVRPSVESKDISYFVGYFNKFLGFALIAFFVGGIPLLPLFWVATLFFLDSRGTSSSLLFSVVNGIKMIIYYSPVWLFLGIAKIVLDYTVVYLMKFVGLGIKNWLGVNNILFMIWDKLFYVVLYLLWLFFLCAMSVYYVRIKHKNFKFFFKKQQI